MIMIQKCKKCGQWNSSQYHGQPVIGKYLEKKLFGTDGDVAIFECSCGNSWSEGKLSKDQSKLYRIECIRQGKKLNIVHCNKVFEEEPLFNDVNKEDLLHIGRHLLGHLLK